MRSSPFDGRRAAAVTGAAAAASIASILSSPLERPAPIFARSAATPSAGPSDVTGAPARKYVERAPFRKFATSSTSRKNSASASRTSTRAALLFRHSTMRRRPLEPPLSASGSSAIADPSAQGQAGADTIAADAKPSKGACVATAASMSWMMSAEPLPSTAIACATQPSSNAAVPTHRRCGVSLFVGDASSSLSEGDVWGLPWTCAFSEIERGVGRPYTRASMFRSGRADLVLRERGVLGGRLREQRHDPRRRERAARHQFVRARVRVVADRRALLRGLARGRDRRRRETHLAEEAPAPLAGLRAAGGERRARGSQPVRALSRVRVRDLREIDPLGLKLFVKGTRASRTRTSSKDLPRNPRLRGENSKASIGRSQEPTNSSRRIR